MTYCVGFVYLDSVYLLADTIVTMTGAVPPDRDTTSFGTSISPPPSQTFVESGVKLLQIHKSCTVAMAGSASRALEAVAMLRQAYTSSTPIESLLKSLTLSLSRSSGGEHFELLLANVDSESKSLWRWDSRTGRANKFGPNAIGRIGWPVVSLDEDLKRFLPHCFALGVSEHAMLLVATAHCQSLFLRSLEVAQGIGVGGIVLSHRLDVHGLQWMYDTNYVVANQGPKGMDTINVRCRDGGFAYASPHSKAAHICLSSANDVQTWKAKWASEVSWSLVEGRAQTWAFLSNTGRGAVIIHASEPFDSCDAFRVESEADGQKTIVAKFDLSFLVERMTDETSEPIFVVVDRATVRRDFAKILRSLNYVSK
jgi:hypothetical protein